MTNISTNVGQLEAHYRALLIKQFRDLKLEGLAETARPVVLPLEEVYVQLRAVAEVPEAADAFTPEERRLLRLLEERRVPDAELREAQLRLDALRQQRWTHERPERFPIAQVLGDPGKRGLVILGDPGSGKSTLLHFLALLFARGPEAVAQHTPARGGDAERLPIFAPLAAYDALLDAQPSLTLQAFLAHYYAHFHNLHGLAPVFDTAIKQGRALILLDGLDEVSDEQRRRFVAEQATQLVQVVLPLGNRVVLTSRIYGYRAAPLGGDLPHVTVLDFGRAEIKLFARQWYRAFLHAQDTEAIHHSDSSDEQRLLDDIASNPGVERLAANPLLLTMLVLLRLEQGELPQRRITLYDAFVSMLLIRWEQLRRRSAQLHDTLLRVDVAETKQVLAALALWLQQHRPSGTATANDLLAVLRDCFMWQDQRLRAGHDPIPRAIQLAATRRAQDFLHTMRQCSGLLIERGQNAFGFRHLTFQEYFAGRALADMPTAERWSLIAPNLHSGRWHEPLLLCAARLGTSQGHSSEASAMVARILDAGSEYEELLHRDLLLAASCAAEDIALDQALLERIASRLWNLLDVRVPDLMRTALRLLSRLWQLRTNEHTRLPELEQLLLAWLLQRIEPYTVFREQLRELFGRMINDGTPGVVDFLHTQLADGIEDDRRAILNMLERHALDDQQVRVAVFAALGDAVPSVREAACRALRSLVATDAEARTALLAMLCDPNNFVRIAASDALGSQAQEDPAVKAALLVALVDPSDEVRRSVIEVLGPMAITDAEVRNALLDRLTDDNDHVRNAAVRPLSKVAETDATVLSTLVAAITDPESPIGSVVVRELGGLAHTHGNVKAAMLVALTDPTLDLQFQAAHALADVAATDMEVRSALFAALSDQHCNVRMAACEALSKYSIAYPEVRSALMDALGDQDTNIRAAAIKGLQQLVVSDSEVRHALIPMLADTWQSLRETTLALLVTSDPQVGSQLGHMQHSREWRDRYSIMPYLTDPAALSSQFQCQWCWESQCAQSAVIETLGTHCADNPSIRAMLLDFLHNGSYGVRKAAINAVASFALTDPQVRNALLAVLADPHLDNWTEVFCALGGETAAHPEVRETLLSILSDPAQREPTRVLAADALSQLACVDYAVRSALLDTFKTTTRSMRVMLAVRLGTLAATFPEVRSALVESLADPESDVRVAAIEALKPLVSTDPEIRTARADHRADSEGWVRASAAVTFPEVRSGLVESLADPESDVRVTAIEALEPLVSTDPEIRAALLGRCADNEGWVRASTVASVGPLALADLEVRNILLSAFADEDWRVVKEAVKNIAPLIHDDSRVRPTLLAALNHPESEVRKQAIKALGNLLPGDTAVQTGLIAALADDTREVRRSAAYLLASFAATDADVRSLLLACEAEDLYDVKPTALKAMGQLALSSEGVRADLLTALASGNHTVRAAVALALHDLAKDDTAVRDALLAAIETSRHWPEVRAVAVRALGRRVQTDPIVRDVLIGALADLEVNVRVAAIEELAPLIPTDPLLYTRLLDAVERDDLTLRNGLIDAGQLRRVVELLTPMYAQIVRTDPQRRAELIAWLVEPDWRERKAAAKVLCAAGPEATLEALPQLLAALEDVRGDEAWFARLAAAERLINNDHYSDQAIALIQEALTHRADALLSGKEAETIRQQAARAVGKLKALHRRADLAEHLAGLLASEPKPEVLNGIWSALGSLVAAPEAEL